MNGNGCLFAVICIIAGIVVVGLLAPGVMLATAIFCDGGGMTLAFFATVVFVVVCIAAGIKNIGK